MTTEWKSVGLYPIPSIIYLIHNNVQFATLTYVDTSTYQIMGNLKIVITGILFRMFLKRKLSNLQLMAIVLLAIGTATSQNDNLHRRSMSSESQTDHSGSEDMSDDENPSTKENGYHDAENEVDP